MGVFTRVITGGKEELDMVRPREGRRDRFGDVRATKLVRDTVGIFNRDEIRGLMGNPFLKNKMSNPSGKHGAMKVRVRDHNNREFGLVGGVLVSARPHGLDKTDGVDEKSTAFNILEVGGMMMENTGDNMAKVAGSQDIQRGDRGMGVLGSDHEVAVTMMVEVNVGMWVGVVPSLHVGRRSGRARGRARHEKRCEMQKVRRKEKGNEAKEARRTKKKKVGGIAGG